MVMWIPAVVVGELEADLAVLQHEAGRNLDSAFVDGLMNDGRVVDEPAGRTIDDQVAARVECDRRCTVVAQSDRSRIAARSNLKGVFEPGLGRHDVGVNPRPDLPVDNFTECAFGRGAAGADVVHQSTGRPRPVERRCRRVDEESAIATLSAACRQCVHQWV